jgi:hypothetical protein
LDVAARFSAGFRAYAEPNRPYGSGAYNCHFALPRLQTASILPLNVDVHFFFVAIAQVSMVADDLP